VNYSTRDSQDDAPVLNYFRGEWVVLQSRPFNSPVNRRRG